MTTVFKETTRNQTSMHTLFLCFTWYSVVYVASHMFSILHFFVFPWK